MVAACRAANRRLDFLETVHVDDRPVRAFADSEHR
jgi:hypothetical protein